MELDIVSYLMGAKAGGGGGGGGGTPTIYSGTETPSSSLGSDGDVYIKYTVQGNSGLVDSQLGWACPPLYYAAKAGTEYGVLYDRWYRKSYDAPGIVCYIKQTSIPGVENPYITPLTISTVKAGASRIDGYSQIPTPEESWNSCQYGGMTWWFDVRSGFGVDLTATGGMLSLQNRITIPSSITTLESAAQYCLEQIGVVTGIATPGTIYIKDSGTWTVAP